MLLCGLPLCLIDSLLLSSCEVAAYLVLSFFGLFFLFFLSAFF